MPLAPEIQAVLAQLQGQPPMHQQPLALLRRPRDRMNPAGFQPVGRVEELEIPGPAGPLPARSYWPEEVADAMPLVLVFHGGGFVFGSVDGYYDHACRVLCAQTRSRVISLAYRLAPEHRFPAATDDCHAALQWAHRSAAGLQVDPARIFVAGGSAGANLATVTALRARDEGRVALAGQILFYPFVDFHAPPSASARQFAEGHYLTLADCAWFWEQYLPDPALRSHPYAVPLAAASLAGLPPALVITAEYDPLRDGGEAYARRMAAAGVDVRLSRYDGMVHGFLAFPTPKADAALDESVAWLRGRVG